ncbi:helix-turn-helix transcriptional regulator [Candidatus Marithioploca araucensis]|uniref:Helix-turn-helix transcriptional regulator n=1 Tax=Candidatus Marithioploca araucensis TaxID=70273 RepID=A0ABT7VRZ7_9GAMM|nr:helix-turn-helix transcriptional regulator [Candidatus Marithioploca araucensis]
MFEDHEMLQDIRDYDETKKQIESGEALIPAEVTFQIIDGANPIKVWREYHQMNQSQLAQAANISEMELSQIESDLSKATKTQLTNISQALNLSLEEINH